MTPSEPVLLTFLLLLTLILLLASLTNLWNKLSWLCLLYCLLDLWLTQSTLILFWVLSLADNFVIDITGKLLPFLLGLALDSFNLNFCLDSSNLLFESLLAINPLLGFGGMAGLWIISLLFVTLWLPEIIELYLLFVVWLGIVESTVLLVLYPFLEIFRIVWI